MISHRSVLIRGQLPTGPGLLTNARTIPCMLNGPIQNHGNIASQRARRNVHQTSHASLVKFQYPRSIFFSNRYTSRHVATPQVPPRGRASYITSARHDPTIHNVFESRTGTWQYIIADPSTLSAAIIDPVLDYDPATQEITTNAADNLLSLVKEKGYKIEKILETHAHADHLTAASYLQKQLAQIQGFKPLIGIGKRIEQVQNLFSRRYGVDKKEYDVVFDTLFEDDEEFRIGDLAAKAVHLPGHTPDHLGYHIGGMGRRYRKYIPVLTLFTYR